MYVNIAEGSATVIDAGNLKALSVHTNRFSPTEVSQALAAYGLGTVADDHAWLNIERLRSSGPTRDHAWAQQFDTMIAYAEKQGWLSADGTAVRAHLDSGS